MYNGNVQQNPLCVESCLSEEISISPRLSRTIFDPDANSVILQAHLGTAVDFMRRKPCVRNCSRERDGLSNGNVQQTLHEQHPVSKNLHISPRFSPTAFYRDPTIALVRDESVKVYLHIHVQRECSAEPSMRKILCE